MRISDWRSDVCSSDLGRVGLPWRPGTATAGRYRDDRRTRPALVLPFPAEPRGAAPGPDTDAAAAPGVVELELSVRTAPRPAAPGGADLLDEPPAGHRRPLSAVCHAEPGDRAGGRYGLRRIRL